jgi:predicted transcriptional regulator
METMTDQLLSLAAQIVSAHVGHNPVPVGDLPALIKSVYATLVQPEAQTPEPEKREPAVPIKKSVFADHIVCLEDGKKLKMLKRHLHTSYGLTPEQYRVKWGLPANYPMVAPNYAEKRSELAKAFGLGRKAEAPEPEAVRKPVGRPRKIAR